MGLRARIAASCLLNEARLAQAYVVSWKVLAQLVCTRASISDPDQALINVHARVPRVVAGKARLDLTDAITSIVTIQVSIITGLASIGIDSAVSTVGICRGVAHGTDRILDGVDEEIWICRGQALCLKRLYVQQPRIAAAQQVRHGSAARVHEFVHGNCAAGRAGRRALAALASGVDAADRVNVRGVVVDVVPCARWRGRAEPLRGEPLRAPVASSSARRRGGRPACEVDAAALALELDGVLDEREPVHIEALLLEGVILGDIQAVARYVLGAGVHERRKHQAAANWTLDRDIAAGDAVAAADVACKQFNLSFNILFNQVVSRVYSHSTPGGPPGRSRRRYARCTVGRTTRAGTASAHEERARRVSEERGARRSAARGRARRRVREEGGARGSPRGSCRRTRPSRPFRPCPCS